MGNYNKNLEKKWEIINIKRYPQTGVGKNFEIDVPEFAPSMKIICYEKDGVKLFCSRHGTLFFYPITWEIGSYKVFKFMLNSIEKWAEEKNYQGKLGFELCELNSLNNVIEYFIKRRGYEVIKEEGKLIVQYK